MRQKCFFVFLACFLMLSAFSDSITRSSDGRMLAENRYFGLVLARTDGKLVWQHRDALTFPGEMSRNNAKGMSRFGTYRLTDTCSYRVTETVQRLSPDAIRFHYDFLTQDTPQNRYLAFGTTIPWTEYKKNPVSIDGVPLAVSSTFREKWIKGKKISIPLESGICEITSEKGISEFIIKPGSRKVMIALVFGYRKCKAASATFSMCYVPYKTVPVDLRKVCNMGFADPVADDGQGGWSDQGPENDLSSMKPGKQRFSNINFDIIAPASNGGRSCILFRGKERPRFADSVQVSVPGISGKFLYLLNALAWPPKKNAPAGQVCIIYADGRTQEYTLKRGIDTDNFWTPRKLENANVVWRSTNGNADIGLFATRIPLHDQPVSGLKFKSVNQVWMVAAASIGFAAPEPMDTQITIKPGRDWVKLPNALNTEKGSVADFSGLLDPPAGRHGFATVRNGRFVFEDGTPVRFWGVNVCSSFHYDAPEAVVSALDHIAACGYNVIRLHHFDNALMLRKDPVSGKDLPEDQIDPEKMAKLDFLLAEAKKRGLYITFDFFTLRLWSQVPRYGKLARREYKVLAYFDDAVRADLLRLSKDLMNHKNPLTGLRWADDPAIIGINLINEATLPTIIPQTTPRCRKIIGQAFGKYLAMRRIDDTPQNRTEHYNAFLEYIGLDFFYHMKRELTAIGVRVPLCDQNYEPTAGKTRHHYDYVDRHFYWSHPTAIGKNSETPPVHVANTSVLAAACSPLRWAFSSAVYGKPMVSSEWNFCYPNSYLFEGGIVIGAYAGLQDISGLMQFYYLARKGDEKNPRLDCFLIGWNPLMRLSARCGALLFLRGDVTPAPRGVLMTEQGAERIERSLLPLITRVRRMTPDAPKDIPLIASPGEPDLPRDRPIILRNEEKSFLKQLRQHRVIPENFTGETGKPIVSVTGELAIEPRSQTMKVLTPKSEALILPPNKTLAGHFLQVRNGTAPAAFFVSGLDGKPLAESRRIILMHLTDVKPDGITFGNREMSIWEKEGDVRKLLLRRNQAEITLNTSHPLKVFACDHTGKRRGEIPVRFDRNKLRITIDNALEDQGVLLYELIRPR